MPYKKILWVIVCGFFMSGIVYGKNILLSYHNSPRVVSIDQNTTALDLKEQAHILFCIPHDQDLRLVYNLKQFFTENMHDNVSEYETVYVDAEPGFICSAQDETSIWIYDVHNHAYKEIKNAAQNAVDFVQQVKNILQRDSVLCLFNHKQVTDSILQDIKQNHEIIWVH